MEINFTEMLNGLRGVLNGEGKPHQVMQNLLVNACAMRGYLLVRNYLQINGDRVFAGPFKGMRLSDGIMPNFLLSRYTGAYEYELAPVVSEAATAGYDTVLNIGCAEGYYAVGLARLMPNVQVRAFDILASAREKCRALADLNGVSDRIVIGERFDPDAFADFAGGRTGSGKTLVLCDIEGGEFDLLDPVRSPALADMDLIVEIHPDGAGRTPQAFHERFAATHDVTPINPTYAFQGELPQWIYMLSEMDVHLASSSLRPSPTPWALLKSKKR